MKASIKGNVLTIELPVNETPQMSKTGKSLVVASTHGIMPSTVTVNGKVVKIGVNAIIASN
jgi:hypothetical protein